METENNLVVQEQEKPKPAAQDTKKALKKPVLIAAIAGAVAVIAVIAIIIYCNLPSTIYTKGYKCLQANEYNKAIAYFQKIITYKDAASQCERAYIGAAKELVNEKKYQEAMDLLDKVTDRESCSEVYLLASMQLVTDKNYQEATDLLSKIDDPEGCAAVYLQAGKQLVADKNYELATEMLDQVADKDACAEVYLQAGKQLVDDGAYEDALPMLAKTEEEEAASYSDYANAMIAMANGKYDDAIKNLGALENFKDSATQLDAAYYQKAEKLFGEKSYADAKKAYAQTKGYDDAAGKMLNCDLMIAENVYKDGDLKKAKELFSALPAELNYNGVSVSGRLSTLDKHADKVKLCGTWKGSNGEFTVRQTHDSTGLWDQWENTYYSSVTIKCVINDDGTFTFKGSADYWVYTNYSSLSAYLKSSSRTVSFSKTGKTIPSELYSSSTVKLTYSDGKIKLVYDYKDANSSMNFTYRYKSSITYKIG